MGNQPISSRIGIGESAFYELLSNVANPEVATNLGVTQDSLQVFLHGSTDYYMASKLGLLEEELQFILNRIGTQGAIGIIMGILIKNAQK